MVRELTDFMTGKQTLNLLSKASVDVFRMCADLYTALDSDVSLTDGEKRAIAADFGDSHESWGAMREEERMLMKKDLDTGIDKVRKYIESRYRVSRY